MAMDQFSRGFQNAMHSSMVDDNDVLIDRDYLAARRAERDELRAKKQAEAKARAPKTNAEVYGMLGAQSEKRTREKISAMRKAQEEGVEMPQSPSIVRKGNRTYRIAPPQYIASKRSSPSSATPTIDLTSPDPKRPKINSSGPSSSTSRPSSSLTNGLAKLRYVPPAKNPTQVLARMAQPANQKRNSANPRLNARRAALMNPSISRPRPPNISRPLSNIPRPLSSSTKTNRGSSSLYRNLPRQQPSRTTFGSVSPSNSRSNVPGSLFAQRSLASRSLGASSSSPAALSKRSLKGKTALLSKLKTQHNEANRISAAAQKSSRRQRSLPQPQPRSSTGTNTSSVFDGLLSSHTGEAVRNQPVNPSVPKKRKRVEEIMESGTPPKSARHSQTTTSAGRKRARPTEIIELDPPDPAPPRTRPVTKYREIPRTFDNTPYSTPIPRRKPADASSSRPTKKVRAARSGAW